MRYFPGLLLYHTIGRVSNPVSRVSSNEHLRSDLLENKQLYWGFIKLLYTNMSKERSTESRINYNPGIVKSNQECFKDTTNQPQLCSFDRIPDEVLLMVFSHLSQFDLAKNCAPVCRRWCNAAMSDCFWRKLSFDDSVPSSVVKALLSCARSPISVEIYDRSDLWFYMTELLLCAEGLEHFSLTYCERVDGFLIRLISDAHQNLKSLNLEGTEADISRLAFIKSPPLLSNLTTLNLVEVGECSTYVLEALSESVHLNSLRLTWDWSTSDSPDCDIPDDYESSFDKFLSKLPSSSLMHLEIDIYGINDVSLHQFSRLRELRSLQLRNAQNLGRLGLQAIGALENLNSLFIEFCDCRWGCIYVDVYSLSTVQLEATDLIEAFEVGKFQNLTTFGFVCCDQYFFNSTSQASVFSAIGECCGALRNVCLGRDRWLKPEGIKALVNSCLSLRLLDISECYLANTAGTASLPSVLKDLEDLFIDDSFPKEVKKILLGSGSENPFPRVTCNTYSNDSRFKCHPIFFEHEFLQ